MTRLREIKPEISKPSKLIMKEEICYHPNISKLEINKEEIIAFLDDGRKTSIPINWFREWGHKNIKSEQLEKYEIWGGKTLHFPVIDAHVGVEVFTEGLKGICPDCH